VGPRHKVPRVTGNVRGDLRRGGVWRPYVGHDVRRKVVGSEEVIAQAGPRENRVFVLPVDFPNRADRRVEALLKDLDA
jgi:hypothetical protein